MCTWCQGYQKRALDALLLELQAVVNFQFLLETEPRVSCVQGQLSQVPSPILCFNVFWCLHDPRIVLPAHCFPLIQSLNALHTVTSESTVLFCEQIHDLYNLTDAYSSAWNLFFLNSSGRVSTQPLRLTSTVIFISFKGRVVQVPFCFLQKARRSLKAGGPFTLTQFSTHTVLSANICLVSQFVYRWGKS